MKNCDFDSHPFSICNVHNIMDFQEKGFKSIFGIFKINIIVFLLIEFWF